jgi:hypothetical protein
MRYEDNKYLYFTTRLVPRKEVTPHMCIVYCFVVLIHSLTTTKQLARSRQPPHFQLSLLLSLLIHLLSFTSNNVKD